MYHKLGGLHWKLLIKKTRKKVLISAWLIIHLRQFPQAILHLFCLFAYRRDIFPFGNDCYLRSDMYHQYAPFYSELWHKLRTGDTLLYSWDIGMGVNFTSLFAYYLASPINWLIALLPQKYMIEIMNMLIVMRHKAS